jgi:uncharacterized YigZ family protein
VTKLYPIPLNEIRREHVVVNSKFIASLAPVFSVEEARAFLTHIKKEFADASHNVPAYIISGRNTVTEFCSDDGEPSGTAGKPVLAVLRGSGLGDVAVVVTRYFGGTLLGTGGLVKAYTESTQMVVNAGGVGSAYSCTCGNARNSIQPIGTIAFTSEADAWRGGRRRLRRRNHNDAAIF